MSAKKRGQPQAPKQDATKSEEEPPGCNIFCHMVTHPHKAPTTRPIIWVLGGPGSGKGTQCSKLIAKYKGYAHLSTGDLLRDEVASGSKRGKELGDMMIRGELVPNELVLELLRNAMDKNSWAKGFLIDGYPREKSQGIAFEKEIAPCSAIVYFEAKPETLTKRILSRAVKSGRIDDNEQSVKLRLKTFTEHNDEVLTQYPNKINIIDSEKGIDEVFSDVERVLKPWLLVSA